MGNVRHNADPQGICRAHGWDLRRMYSKVHQHLGGQERILQWAAKHFAADILLPRLESRRPRFHKVGIANVQ